VLCLIRTARRHDKRQFSTLRIGEGAYGGLTVHILDEDENPVSGKRVY